VLEEALDIYRDIGNRNGEAEALNDTGALHRISGDLARAQRCHQQALDLARVIASSRNEAKALAGLGRCALAAGHSTQAGVLLRQALEIFRRIGAAEADDVARELTALTEASPPAWTRPTRTCWRSVLRVFCMVNTRRHCLTGSKRPPPAHDGSGPGTAPAPEAQGPHRRRTP